MAGTAVITAKAQTANEDMLDAIRRAFPAVDESLKRIAMLNSLLATTDRLQLEGDAYAGFEEVLYGIEDALTLAARAMTPAFNRWQVRRDRAVTGAD